ncbi:MAG: GNAT family N-acetyltransferase, partial [bacterium]
MIITSSRRLVIRQFASGDADAMSAVLGDPDVMRFSDNGVLSPGEFREWTERQLASYRLKQGPGRWAIATKARGTVIGYAGLTFDTERCEPDELELGFRLAKAYWRRGYASEAAAAVVDYGFVTLQPRRIIAFVDPANTASVRVIERLGLRFESLVNFPGYGHPD